MLKAIPRTTSIPLAGAYRHTELSMEQEQKEEEEEEEEEE